MNNYGVSEQEYIILREIINDKNKIIEILLEIIRRKEAEIQRLSDENYIEVSVS